MPFEGICLTDTFQLYEKEDIVSDVLVDNSARRNRQKKLDIRVIVGNPPYSVGQKSANDNNQNLAYPQLDARIAETYAAKSDATNKNALYDSYIRAIRWASHRIGSAGVIGFVTNANFIEASGASGVRTCLVDEFSSLYVFHLRGNARTAGESRRKEAGNVFGHGSRAPVAISLLVKNPQAGRFGDIFFRDVGDYLTREEKLDAIVTFSSIAGVSKVNGWTSITPDVHGDWLKQRDESFGRFLAAGDKATPEAKLFTTYSNGVKTQRDAWAYGLSRRIVSDQMLEMISFFNSESRRFMRVFGAQEKVRREQHVDGFVNSDSTKISWTRALKNELAKGAEVEFTAKHVVLSLYRPFTRQWLYFDRKLNEMVYQQLRLFPIDGKGNRVVGVSASESRAGYSVLMADVVPSLHATDMVGSQYFPLYVYDEETGERSDGITDAGLKHFQDFYPGETISKEDIFYYVYGILHSPDYRTRYADNLGKELPRIPRVSKVEDFWAFSKAGRRLGELHVNFEQQPEYLATIDAPSKPNFRVEKMKFARRDGEKDKTIIQYNDSITVRNVPLAAYEYVVNGKPAIEWVMERQAVTTDKDSGIVKDANDYAKETMKDARYPLSLLLRVITVSLETVDLVKALPRVDDAALSRDQG